ncbi:ATP-binding protein [Leekyejoonella antrihumi]|uniref:AfsR/SARP family transcriptional regulator n=1 Tax=Leekyejoonella antrihumi TaxID=1660198 RepID=A0A563DSV9_9MICO|nr:BTAD domain-containing putative transcriptional regulator [Leekyejoonella antrihumi]TWP33315.1 AfsR/SARP family transcriptional regulator [Leekyejoonella antrihumi]
MATQLTLLPRVAYQDRPVASPQLRQLLAALAADLSTGASTSRLIQQLWPRALPDHPNKALQVLVSRGRSQLGPELIVNTPSGYRLGLPADEVDSSCAVLKVAACDRAAREGDHAAALSHAESGLALWHDAPPTADDGDDPLSVLRSERVSTYAALARVRALSLSRLGRHDDALPLLIDLVGARPREEQLLAALLRSEAVATSPSAALIRYEAYRRSLRDDLGSDPGPELQAVQRELLTGGRMKIRSGVTFEPNSLVGRDEDLTAVGNLIRSSRVTSIVGPGGLGKTRLAHLVSHRADQPQVQFVPLVGVSSSDAVTAEVASALGVRDQRIRPNVHVTVPRDVLSSIIEALSPGPSLLVLDNCEHVVDGVADLVRSLISLSPNLRVLTTSRAPLGVTSESVYLLPELDLAMSIDLFTQRARAARPGVDLPVEVVRALCGHLDGLPLALELAAARTRVMSVSQIAARLGDRFALLRGGPRDAPERHRTLQAVIDWSWNLLKPSEQSTLAALSVFPDGFTLDAAEALLRDATGPNGLVDSLDALIEQSLLKVEDRPGGTRYRMLETVREFGAARLEMSGDARAMRAQFQRWATAFGAACAEPVFGADPVPVIDRLRDEQDNLVAALRTAITDQDELAAAATFGALGALWTVESNHSRTLAYSGEVAALLSHFRPDPAQVEIVRCALVLCASDIIMGQRSGLRALVALRKLPKAVPDNLIRAFAVLLPHIPQLMVPGAPLPPELRNSQHQHLLTATSVIVGQVWENDGQPDKALAESERLLAGETARQGLWQQALVRSRIGELYLQTGRLDEGERYLRSAIPVLERIGATSDVQVLRWSIALAALSRGDVPSAEAELEHAGKATVENPFGPNVNDDLRVRAELDLVRGDVPGGLRRWRRLLDRLSATVGNVIVTDPPGLEPWSLSTEAQTLIAHARYDHLPEVAGLERTLRSKLQALGERARVLPPNPFTLDLPVFGMGLLAIGLARLRAGSQTGARIGAAMVVLADTMQYPRYQPSMSREWSAEFARETAGSAYDSAVESYAELPLDERVPEGVRLLEALDQA